ncbi:condensation domain-containing protein [Streptomyces sp. NPDC051569]|uniref:condensation domain-containing protein n=1 Tax=Streptomyces sp. NPDC051569 TaxID=3365661 RepID=UPI00379E21B5
MIPLSFAQRRLWFLNRLEGPSPTYNAPVVLRMDGVPDRDALEAAVGDVVERHEVLRTVFPVSGSEPYQDVLASPGMALAVTDCAPGTVDGLVAAFTRETFDITGQVPLRVRLFVPGDGTSVLVLLLHHVASDGWSLGPLLEDLSEAYLARLGGRAPRWDPLPVQYADYTLWQRDMLGDAEDPHSVAAEQLDYWRAALDGLPPVVDLPADRPRPVEPTHRGATVTALLGAGTHRELVALSRDRRASLFMVVRSALAAALAAAGAGNDIAIGTAVAGRPEEDLHELVGFFVNTVVLRTDLSGDPSVGELVERVREADLGAYAHEDLPFDLLVEHLSPERALAHHPFFQVMLTLQPGEDAPVGLGAIRGVPAVADLGAAKFDLTLYCTENHDAAGAPAGIDIGLQYAADLFDADTAQLLLDLYVRALEAFAEEPGARLGELGLLTDDEQAALTVRRERLRAGRDEKAAASAAPAPRAALDPREEILCGLFAEVLGHEDVGADDNFFRIGGHSLLASKLVNRIRAVLGIETGIRDLFLAPTVRGLSRRIAEQGDGAGPRPALLPVPAGERPGRIPLSYAQRRLWFVNELEGPNRSYNVPVVLRLDRPLDPSVLAEALADLVIRHEVLRTVYRTAGGEPYQLVLDGVRPRLDLIRVPGDGLAAAVDNATAHVFDLATELPFRATLLTPADGGGQILVLLLHHIAGDGWSTGPLLADLTAAYLAREDGGEPAWEPLPVQYADYTLWQHDMLGDAADAESLLARQLAHWGEVLAGAPPLIALPTDLPRPAEPSHRGGLLPFRLDAAAHQRLTRIAHECGATLFMVVQAALAATLGRHGAGTDLMLGTTVAGRGDDALHPMVGFFVNTLPLRTDTAGNPAFADLVRRIRDTDLAAYSHQDVPFDRLVEHLNPHRSAAHHPLVQVMLQVHAADTGTVRATGALAGEPYPSGAGAAKVDLTFALTETKDAAGAPGGLSGVVEYATDLYTPATAALLATHLTRVLRAVTEDSAMRIDDIALLTPEEEERLLAGASGAADDGRSARLVHERFAAQARRTPDRVAVSFGDETLTYAELDARADALARRLVRGGVRRGDVVGVLLERGFEQIVAALAVLRAGAGSALLAPEARPDRALAATGATVLLSRRTLVARVGPARPARLVLVDDTADTADAADTAGASPVALPAGDPRDTAAVCLVLDASGGPLAVRTAHGTLTSAAWPGAGGARHVDMAVSSEAFTERLWGALLTGASVVLRPARPYDRLPSDGRRRLVLDHRLRPVPAGVPGELYLSGATPGDGYPARPGATAVAYVPDPFGLPGALMTRTGERVVRTPDGSLRHLGRIGERARVGGYQVDPALVADVLARHASVARAVTVVREDRPGSPRLVAYAVPRHRMTIDEAELRAWAAGQLPEYTVPSAVVALAALPMTVDGRTDRAALPAPAVEPGPDAAAEEGADGGRPRDHWREVLSELFSEVLEGKQVGPDDNFFRVGGHSLLAVRLVNRVRTVLGVEITLRDVFRYPSVSALAGHLAGADGTAPAAAPGAKSVAEEETAAERRPTLRRRTQAGARVRESVRQP